VVKRRKAEVSPAPKPAAKPVKKAVSIAPKPALLAPAMVRAAPQPRTPLSGLADFYRASPYSPVHATVTFQAPARKPRGAPSRCNCCRGPAQGKCGVGHACVRGVCYVALCRYREFSAWCPPRMVFPADSSDGKVVEAQTDAAWTVVVTEIHRCMAGLKKTASKKIVVDVPFYPLFWAQRLGGTGKLSVQTFSSPSQLNFLFGEGWAERWVRAIKPSRVHVLDDIIIKLFQVGTACPDVSGIASHLAQDPDPLPFAQALMSTATLVDLVWHVSVECRVMRTG
jgi:hypothetical protein